MKKSLRILIVVLLAIAALTAGGVLSFRHVVSKSPERVTATVQQHLQRNLGVPVTIGRARFEWKGGPRVILSRVDIREPGVVTLHIRSITAYLSTVRLLFGDVSVGKVRLIMPTGTIDLDNLARLGAPDEARPAVLIWKGDVKVVYRGMDIPLEELSGRITRDWANLRARMLGGRVLLETDLERPGKMTFDAYGIHLDQLDDRLRGIAHANITVEDSQDGLSGSFSIQVKDLVLPWVRGAMDRIAVSSSLRGDARRMKLTDITVKTPFIEATGSGELAGPAELSSWQDAVINLEASSKEFDYEEVVSHLPSERFPEWLGTLLTRQIRGGRSRFSTASYQGALGGVLSGADLLHNIHVVQELKGQSFCAGHGPERITGITGQVIYGRGDIRFRDMSGMAGASRLDRVDILFPGVAKPRLRVGVDVELDLPAADFMQAWQAAMVPGEVHGLLAPVSKVTAGRITGRAHTFYEEGKRNPFMSRGDVRLSDCAFTWDTHQVTGLTGSVRSDSFSKPQDISMSATVDRTRVRSLNLSLVSPFGEGLSRFTLAADRLPPLGKLDLEGATVRVTGRGRGLDLNGTAEMSARAVSHARGGVTYRVAPVTAQGVFRARIKGSPSVSLTGLDIRSPSSRLEGKAEWEGTGGSAALSGRIGLKDISLQGRDKAGTLSGEAGGSLSLAWGSTPSAAGTITLHDAVLPLAGELMTVNGHLVMGPSRISTEGLHVRIQDVRSTLSGYVTSDERPAFRGEITVEGLRMDGTGRKIEGLRDFRADARLHLAQCVLFGLPVEAATADARLAGGVIDLDNLEVRTVSGTARGTANLSMDGASSFDVMVSLTGSDLGKLLGSTGRPAAIDGSLDLRGRLWGSADSLNGNLVMDARNGEIRKYALVSQVFSMLNVYRIARNLDMDVLSRHFTYNRISSTLTIRDSVIGFDDFSLDSNSIQVSAVGTYMLGSKKIDAIIGVQPLETLDRTVSLIPVVGWVLSGDDGRFIVVSMRLGGTMDDPKVMIAPVETLSNTVAASLLRSLRLPGKLVEETLRVINGAKK